MSDEFLHRAQLIYHHMFVNYCQEIDNSALIDIENRILVIGGDQLPTYGSPRLKHA